MVGAGVRRLEVVRVIGVLEVLVHRPGSASSNTPTTRSSPVTLGSSTGWDRCADREPAGRQRWSWSGPPSSRRSAAGTTSSESKLPARRRVAVAGTA
jgi:hypothetical protein